MNPDTNVVVCGYAGDAHQISAFMPLYRHHKRPVLVLSPEDSQITPGMLPKVPGVTCRYGGKRAYIGADSLLRQKRHMEMALEMPGEWFLLNDSDSFCVDAEIPKYVYEDPGCLWSNEVSDEMHTMPPGYSFPRLAFQPPYFCSRWMLSKLVAVHEWVGTDYPMQFIDHYMMRLAHVGQVTHRTYHNTVCCETKTPDGVAHMIDSMERRGSIFIHAVKDLDMAKRIYTSRQKFRSQHR